MATAVVDTEGGVVGLVTELDGFLCELEMAVGLPHPLPGTPPATLAAVGDWLRPRAAAVLAAVLGKVPGVK